MNKRTCNFYNKNYTTMNIGKFRNTCKTTQKFKVKTQNRTNKITVTITWINTIKYGSTLLKK